MWRAVFRVIFQSPRKIERNGGLQKSCFTSRLRGAPFYYGDSFSHSGVTASIFWTVARLSLSDVHFLYKLCM